MLSLHFQADNLRAHVGIFRKQSFRRLDMGSRVNESMIFGNIYLAVIFTCTHALEDFYPEMR